MISPSRCFLEFAQYFLARGFDHLVRQSQIVSSHSVSVRKNKENSGVRGDFTNAYTHRGGWGSPWESFSPRRTPLCAGATVRIMAALRTVLGCKINDLACAHHDGADFTYRRLLAMRQCWVSGGSRPSAAARLLASSISSSSVLSSNAPGSPTSRRSMMRPSILALPIDACTAAEG